MLGVALFLVSLMVCMPEFHDVNFIFKNLGDASTILYNLNNFLFFLYETVFLLSIFTMLLSISILFESFNKRASYLSHLKSERDLIKEIKVLIGRIKKHHDCEESNINDLENRINKNKYVPFLNQFIDRDVILLLSKKIKKEDLKWLSLFCKDQNKITYGEIVKFLNYKDKKDNSMLKIFIKEKDYDEMIDIL